MAKNSMIHAADALSIAQRLVGKTQAQVMSDKGVNLRTVQLLKKESPLSGGATRLQEAVLQFLFGNTPVLCYFPGIDDCKWVTVLLRSPSEVKSCREYCNDWYDFDENTKDNWYNKALDTFITIVYDEDEEGYILAAMKMEWDMISRMMVCEKGSLIPCSHVVH